MSNVVKKPSLWGNDFAIEIPNNKSAVIEKVSNPKNVKKNINSKTLNIQEKMLMIESEVNRVLGKYKNDIIVIRTEEELSKYIDKAISNNVIAIDTETNNTLNTFDCLIMGLCLYTPNMKAAYIPVNHVNKITREKLPNQITEEQIRNQLQRLLDNNVFEIYHNAVFDLEVIKTTCNIMMEAHWDTQIGSQLIDENEPKGLKYQYRLRIDPEQEKYDIEHLFQGLEYSIFDPELFSLYAATDSKITYELYLWQKRELGKEENKDVLNLFNTIEIPVIKAIVSMEMAGVEIDLDYAKKMSKIYHSQSDGIKKEIDLELLSMSDKISSWKNSKDANSCPIKEAKKNFEIVVDGISYSYINEKSITAVEPYWYDNTNNRKVPLSDYNRLKLVRYTFGKTKNQQLSNPIDLDSPTQLAILLYDIIKVPVINKDRPRTTDTDALETLADDKHIKICELMVKKREIDILINTFIDKLPEFAQKDGRVHPRFNSTGTLTGRFSCSNPNLQQIPSHDKTVRMMFKASKGCSIVGGDYSGQEPRSLCSFAKDLDMQKAYEEKKDLYAIIASKCFHNNYEENLEFNPITGEQQSDGKDRRSKAKTVFLGTLYGMGAKKLSERMNLPLEEAQQIIDDFFKGFPGVENFTKESQEMARRYGYATDIFGRKRHLPDAALPEYEFKYINALNSKFNPILDIKRTAQEVPKNKKDFYIKELENAKWKSDKMKILESAEKEGISIKNNSAFISRAQRQTLNSRIQGSAASMTKLAMIMINNDEKLNSLGFKLLVTVHDEVFGECPTENSEEAGKRLCEVMVEAANMKCSFTRWSVDPYMVKRWYSDECCTKVSSDFEKECKKTNNINEALNKIKNKYSMIQSKYVEMMCNGTYDPNTYEDI